MVTVELVERGAGDVVHATPPAIGAGQVSGDSDPSPAFDPDRRWRIHTGSAAGDVDAEAWFMGPHGEPPTRPAGIRATRVGRFKGLIP